MRSRIGMLLATVLTLVALGVPVGVHPATAAAGQDRLNPGETLGPDQEVVSPNGLYHLTMQNADGNTVLYGAGHVALWASNTVGHPGSVLSMQGSDGNAVIYAPGNVAIAATYTTHDPGSVLIVQDDGNVVIYAPGNRPVWATNTAQSSSTPSTTVPDPVANPSFELAAAYGGKGHCPPIEDGTGSYRIKEKGFYDINGCEIPLRVGTATWGYVHIRIEHSWTRIASRDTKIALAEGFRIPQDDGTSIRSCWYYNNGRRDRTRRVVVQYAGNLKGILTSYAYNGHRC